MSGYRGKVKGVFGRCRWLLEKENLQGIEWDWIGLTFDSALFVRADFL